MLARAQKQIGDLVVRDELLVGHLADEMDVGQAEGGGQVSQAREIPLEPRVGTDDEQARAHVVDGVIRMKKADQILDLLVRDHAAHKQDVRPCIVELFRHKGVRRTIEVRKIGDDRQHGRPWKAKRVQVLPVELGVAERQIAALAVRAELPASTKTLPRELPIDADEVFGRRDVVVDERHPIGQRERRPGGLRPEREVVKQQIVRMAVVNQFAIVARQWFEARVGRFDKDLGLVAGCAQNPLNAEHLVADRVAVPERCEHLVDANHARLRSWSEAFGSRSSTSSAGARSLRRRSPLPGSGSIP